MILIGADVGDADTRRLWTAVGKLAVLLPPRWVLIGGLMVQIHAMEHGLTSVRATRDVDVLGQARPPGALPAIDAALRGGGFTALAPDRDGFAHRYERDGLIVDLLAPDGIRPPPALGAGRRAIGVPGGSQALARGEEVTVRVAAGPFAIRRPSLLGAILIKARSLMVHADPASQREDLLRLLSLVADPRTMAEQLRRSERGWLRAADARLDLDGPSLLDADAARRARQVFRLLLQEA